ncbi:MAG: hypothetical protein WD048_00780 [Chitinophagales bacterium]
MIDLLALLDLPKHPKTALFAFLVLAPFWYLNIVTFNINSVFTQSMEVPIIFASCLASLHLFISYLLVLFWQNWFYNNAFVKMQKEPVYMFVFTTSVSVAIVSLLSYFFYSFGYRFYWLVSTILFGESFMAFFFFMKCKFRGDFSKSE